MRCLATALAWMCVAFVPASSGQDTRPAGDGRIAGRVLRESGAGIDGAVVWAILFTGQPHATARYSATTATDGGYVIERLPAGRYNVFAEKPGYTNIVVQSDRMSGGRSLDLEAAGAASGIDLVLRRTGSVAGRVTRPDGTPVEKARVVTQIRLPNGRMLGTGRGALTDANGQYRLEDVPPGRYVVTAIYSILHERIGKAVPDGHQYWAPTFHPASTDFERATPMTIEGGEHLEGLDITLQPQHRYRVSGVMIADDGSALRNMRVEYSSGTGMSGVTHVLGDARFTVGSVSGPVRLLGSAETDNGALIGLTELTVTSSLDGVRIVLGSPARVRGRVRFEGAPPPRKAPLEVQLATDWFRAHPPNENPDTARVGEDDQFSIANVIGERRVRVLGLPPQWEVKEVRRGGRVLPDTRLALAAGELVDDLEIVIARRP